MRQFLPRDLVIVATAKRRVRGAVKPAAPADVQAARHNQSRIFCTRFLRCTKGVLTLSSWLVSASAAGAPESAKGIAVVNSAGRTEGSASTTSLPAKGLSSCATAGKVRSDCGVSDGGGA